MKNFLKKYWLYLALVIGLIWFLLKTFIITIENYQLSRSGQITKAIVTNRNWESSSYRNSNGFYYGFTIKGIYYEGHTFDQDLLPNDSIIIIYLPEDPKINRPFEFIQRNYKVKNSNN